MPHGVAGSAVYRVIRFGDKNSRHAALLWVISASMSGPNIFEFSDPTEFLRDVLRKKKQINPRFSMRAWARQMGLKNQSLLSLILQEKRRLKSSIAGQIRRSLQLSPQEQKYFDLLVLFRNAETDEERAFYQEALLEVHPEKQFSLIRLDLLRVLSDWCHFAVLEMVRLKDFHEDPEWIAARLGNQVEQIQIQQIVNRLLRLELVERTPEGKLQQKTLHRTTPDDVPNSVIRKIQKEFMDQAKLALEQQAIDEREFYSFTFCLKKSDLAAAKEKIREFRREFAQSFDAEQGDEVYQLGIQLFRVTSPAKGENNVDLTPKTNVSQ